MLGTLQSSGDTPGHKSKILAIPLLILERGDVYQVNIGKGEISAMRKPGEGCREQGAF